MTAGAAADALTGVLVGCGLCAKLIIGPPSMYVGRQSSVGVMVHCGEYIDSGRIEYAAYTNYNILTGTVEITVRYGRNFHLARYITRGGVYRRSSVFLAKSIYTAASSRRVPTGST